MTANPRILIVEDEPLLRHQLRDTLLELWPELSVIDEADCGIAAISRVNEALPDIAFLDIHLPDMSGIEIARLLRGRCRVVFVTAYDEYAVTAFEQEALDYVLKPATVARLADTVARLKNRQLQAPPAEMDQLLAQIAQRISPKSDAYLRWLTVSTGNTMQLIPVEDALFFHADDKYTQVVTADSEALMRKPIRELTAELDPEKFWQIHRSTVVNVAAIARVVRATTGQLTVHLRNSQRSLHVSRAYAYRFRQM